MEALKKQELQEQKRIEIKDCQKQSETFSTKSAIKEKLYDGFAVRNGKFLSFDWNKKKARFIPLRIDSKTGNFLKEDKDVGLIIIDTERDQVLKEMSDWAKSLKDLPIEQKSFLIAQKIDIIMGGRGLEVVSYIEELERSKRDVMIGEINAKNKIGGSSLHRALLFHKLAKEAEIDTCLRRGYRIDANGWGTHVWNDIRNENGKILIVDIMYPTIKEGDFRTISHELYQEEGGFPEPSSSCLKHVDYLDINGEKIYS